MCPYGWSRYCYNSWYNHRWNDCNRSVKAKENKAKANGLKLDGKSFNFKSCSSEFKPRAHVWVKLMENLLEVIQKALKKNTICNGKIPQITLNFNVSRTVREITAPQLEYYFLNQHFLLLQVKESLSNHLSKRMKKMGGDWWGRDLLTRVHCP